MTNVKEDRLLDARGLLCPMPVVKAAKEIRGLEPGQVLKVMATDRGAIADFPAWAEDTGNPLLEWHEEGGSLVFWFRKGGLGGAGDPGSPGPTASTGDSPSEGSVK